MAILESSRCEIQLVLACRDNKLYRIVCEEHLEATYLSDADRRVSSHLFWLVNLAETKASIPDIFTPLLSVASGP